MLFPPKTNWKLVTGTLMIPKVFKFQPCPGISHQTCSQLPFETKSQTSKVLWSFLMLVSLLSETCFSGREEALELTWASHLASGFVSSSARWSCSVRRYVMVKWDNGWRTQARRRAGSQNMGSECFWSIFLTAFRRWLQKSVWPVWIHLSCDESFIYYNVIKR